MRKTPSFVAFFSRIAVLRSDSIRSVRFTRENYDAETLLSILLLVTKTLGARAKGRNVPHQNNFNILPGPLEQPCENPPRPELDEEIASKRDQPLHAIAPPNRTCDLLLQGLSNFDWRLPLPAGHIADHRKTRRINLNVRQSRAEFFISAFHQA